MAMGVSRNREYLADATGAQLTRNPAALASALEKIDAAVEPTKSIKRGAAHLCIADPLGRSVNDREGPFSNLFGTHPPIRQRIIRLRGMAFQHMKAAGELPTA
jgi:heat shock protein HtpX